jgi:hypothetical protein
VIDKEEPPMRLSRVRLTVRRMMFAIAVVAIALAIGNEVDRLTRFRADCLLLQDQHEQAQYYDLYSAGACIRLAKSAERAVFCVAEFDRYSLEQSRDSQSTQQDEWFANWRSALVERCNREAIEHRGEAKRAAECAVFHGAMKLKYARAAMCPWLPMKPDPPAPAQPARQHSPWLRGHSDARAIQFEESESYGPASAREVNAFAWFLSTNANPALRDGQFAVELASLAWDLTSRTDPNCLDTLAAAYAERGEFASAVKTQNEAITLLSEGDPKQKEYRARLELYESKRPYRDTSKLGLAFGS